ncbi:polysaccharide deacetylase family protein [Marinifilum sp.]|uniref:polysaccharide deacetylase family protein n=1 Tax=Marinifilum sp. TaxID=2033137 RepID=UPI003BA8F46C
MDILKKYIGNIIGLLLILLCSKSALKQFDKQVLSIYFHNPSLPLFKGIIRFLIAKGFSFISEDDYYKIVEGEKEVQGRTAFVSFDDGWKGNLKLIPVLKKYKIPASFFVPVRSVITGNFWWEFAPIVIKENPEYTSVEELKKLPNHERLSLIRDVSSRHVLKRSCIDLLELKRLSEHPLFSIGSHTYHHPITIKCSDAELDFEYCESKKTLEEWLDIKIKSFSYPNGDFNQRDIALLKEYEYQMAFTTEPDLDNGRISVYQIPRVSINSNGGTYENIARMLRVWHKFVQPLQQKPLLGIMPTLIGS